MRKRSVGIRAWARMLGLEKTVRRGGRVDENGAIVISVRPNYSQRDRCPALPQALPGL